MNFESWGASDCWWLRERGEEAVGSRGALAEADVFIVAAGWGVVRV